MKRVLPIALMIACVVMFIIQLRQWKDCRARGGAYVKSFGWYQCVEKR